MLKKCNKCQNEYDLSGFSKDKYKKDGHNNICKKCVKMYQIENKERIKEYNDIYSKDYYIKNREHLKLESRLYEINNPEKVARYRKQYREENKDYFAQYMKRYTRLNREKLNKKVQIRRQIDPVFKMLNNIRSNFRRAWRNGYKTGSAIKNLGCSVDFFLSFIESKFYSGMDWENYGIGPETWQLDHIIPICSIDPKNKEEVLKVCHYTNFQPLWFHDHVIKNRVDNTLNLKKRPKV